MEPEPITQAEREGARAVAEAIERRAVHIERAGSPRAAEAAGSVWFGAPERMRAARMRRLSAGLFVVADPSVSDAPGFG